MDKEKRPVGRPPRTDKNNKLTPSGEKGTMPGDKRKTYIVNVELANKIDAIAYWDRTSVKEVVKDAFENKVKKYEQKNGKIKLP